ncbi:MAG TPA: condensation domain-containing protein, partial [Thermoanaerobaculia bacterium]|nr:condensation domain-containing protein [Thermoanaerobaculia bacterium]
MSGQVQGFRLSPQQRHVWRLQAESRAYRSQIALLLDGDLDAEALHRALTAAAGRHEALRTGFRRSPGVRFPLQTVAEAPPPPLWQTADLAEKGEDAIDDLFRQAARRPFDMERGPLVHAWLATLGPGRHLLVLGVPALCADRTALRSLVRDVAAAYDGSLPAEEPVQYAQFSEWQNELLSSDESLSGREFWHHQGQAAPLGWRLPLEGGTPGGGYAPERTEVPVSPELAARLESLAEAAGVPVAAVLLAAWQALLARLTGEQRLGVGVVLDGRQQEGLEDAVGLFARCVPLASRTESDDTFRHLVARAQEAWSEAADWQVCYAPEEGERALAGMPAGFEIVEQAEPVQAGGITVSPLREVSLVERFKIGLTALRGARGGDRLSLELHHDPRLFPADYVRTLADRFVLLLGALVAEPDRPVGEAELLNGAERRRLLAGLNDTAASYPADRCVHQLFAEQAARTPEAPAVELLDESLTYADLDDRASRLARFLRGLGVGPDTVVGVCMERSLEMAVALLGVLKAGGAYLPLDSTYPRERLAFMAADSGVQIVLSQSKLAELLP